MSVQRPLPPLRARRKQAEPRRPRPVITQAPLAVPDVDLLLRYLLKDQPPKLRALVEETVRYAHRMVADRRAGRCVCRNRKAPQRCGVHDVSGSNVTVCEAAEAWVCAADAVAGNEQLVLDMVGEFADVFSAAATDAEIRQQFHLYSI